MDSFSLLLSVFIILGPIILYFKYLTKGFNYWTKRGLNGPRAYPIFGSSLIRLFRPTPLIELDWAKRYGSIYGVFNGWQPCLSVSEPELIKTILVKDFHVFTDRRTGIINHEILSKTLVQTHGSEWRRLRPIISPTFASGKMRKMYPMIGQCGREFIDHLERTVNGVNGGRELDLKHEYSNYSMDVIATCAFAIKTHSYSDPNCPFILNARQYFDIPLSTTLAMWLLPRTVLKWLGIKSWANDRVNQFYFQITKQRLDERKKVLESNQNINDYNKQYNDFLQLLVDAEDVDTDSDEQVSDTNSNRNQIQKVKSSKNNCGSSGSNGNKKLTDDEIMAQGWTLFLGGFESTANTMAFASYELALNPSIQDRLYDEISAAGVDPNTGDIPYDVLTQLPYLNAVLSETLRLYSPVLRTSRSCRATDGYKLGSTGIELYYGQEVEIPIYAIHHSSTFYPNPQKFDPDRFMPENRNKLIPYTYLPFGVGPRNCIAMRFSLLEAKLGLAQAVLKFRFLPCSKTSVPLIYKAVTHFCQAQNIILKIEKR